MARTCTRSGATNRRTVEITRHAMQRLEERVKSFAGYRSGQNLVNTARYEGRGEQNMTDEEYDWYLTHAFDMENHSVS